MLKADLAEFVGTVTGEAKEALATVLQHEEEEEEEEGTAAGAAPQVGGWVDSRQLRWVVDLLIDRWTDVWGRKKDLTACMPVHPTGNAPTVQRRRSCQAGPFLLAGRPAGGGSGGGGGRGRGAVVGE